MPSTNYTYYTYDTSNTYDSYTTSSSSVYSTPLRPRPLEISSSIIAQAKRHMLDAGVPLLGLEFERRADTMSTVISMTFLHKMKVASMIYTMSASESLSETIRYITGYLIDYMKENGPMYERR